MEYHVRVLLLWSVIFGAVILGVSRLFCSTFSSILEPAACDQLSGTIRSVVGWFGG
jgi:hypothetical protein